MTYFYLKDGLVFTCATTHPTAQNPRCILEGEENGKRMDESKKKKNSLRLAVFQLDFPNVGIYFGHNETKTYIEYNTISSWKFYVIKPVKIYAVKNLAK